MSHSGLEGMSAVDGTAKIRDLLARDLNQKIEEIIKVDQHDEESVYREITEYVVTDRIRNQYKEILSAIAEAPADPHEGIGVWISGFFGSGKSSFAKNLGYVLANRNVLGHSAAELFRRQVADERIGDLIHFINARIPTEVVMFDVSRDRAVRKGTERMTEITYTVLLRELDYAEDFDIAELEIELEAEGRLEEFTRRVEQRFGQPWRMIRKGAQKISRASAALYEMDPATYPEPESWARSLATKQADITVARFVERVFELTSRRRPSKAVVLIIDEVGQFVARSEERIDDLRVLMEQLGKESKNRVKAGKAVAPVWVIVTSQEKLDEVVAAIDSKRVELARLQDRFKYRIDLAPADIREVATKRVLAKKEAAYPILQDHYRRTAGILSSACRLERTARRSEVSEEDFIQFYPYLPHMVELSIDIMSGIRLQPGAPRQHGGSNRTIIKQAYEMLVSDRTRMADRPVGSLVPLDLIFELVEGNLSDERRKDISDIVERFKNDPDDKGWAARVAKAVCLLEYVRDLPRTEQNIAALLLDEVGRPAPLHEVRSALARLAQAKFIRNTDEGYKLQTAQEKNWETEKEGYLDPKLSERNSIKREILGEVFSDPRLRTYRFRDLRNFKIGLSVDGMRVGDEGHITLNVRVADEVSEYSELVNSVRDESRAEVNRNEVYWVMALTDEIHDLVRNLYASREMVKKYEGLRAKGKITQVELDCLANEKNEALKHQARLKDKMTDAFLAGTGIFQGVAKDGSALGKTAGEALKAFLDAVIPELYPKLEMGARPLKGDEAEQVLKAANLDGLPQVFYGGETGLNLVVREGGKFVLNTAADVAAEILNYIKYVHSYGEKVTGKTLEDHFQGAGYGWERDLLRLVLAVLLRAGAIEVTYEGRRYTSHQDLQARVPLTNNAAFKAASFAPSRPVDIKTLTEAARHYEAITGTEVDVEREAIAGALKNLAQEDKEKLLEVEALVKTNQLPVADIIGQYKATLNGILEGMPEDCVLMLARDGKSFKEARERVQRIRKALDKGAAGVVAAGRRAIRDMWPVLSARGENGRLETCAGELEQLIAAEDFYDSLAAIKEKTAEIVSAYHALYGQWHADRASAFGAAIEEIKVCPEWAQLGEDMRNTILVPLVSRACSCLDLGDASTVCTACRATVNEMEADLAGLSGFKAEALRKLRELAAPQKVTKRVRLADFFPPAIEHEESIDEAVDELREELHKLVAEGFTIILE